MKIVFGAAAALTGAGALLYILLRPRRHSQSDADDTASPHHKHHGTSNNVADSQEQVSKGSHFKQDSDDINTEFLNLAKKPISPSDGNEELSEKIEIDRHVDGQINVITSSSDNLLCTGTDIKTTNESEATLISSACPSHNDITESSLLSEELNLIENKFSSLSTEVCQESNPLTCTMEDAIEAVPEMSVIAERKRKRRESIGDTEIECVVADNFDISVKTANIEKLYDQTACEKETLVNAEAKIELDNSLATISVYEDQCVSEEGRLTEENICVNEIQPEVPSTEVFGESVKHNNDGSIHNDSYSNLEEMLEVVKASNDLENDSSELPAIEKHEQEELEKQKLSKVIEKQEASYVQDQEISLQEKILVQEISSSSECASQSKVLNVQSVQEHEDSHPIAAVEESFVSETASHNTLAPVPECLTASGELDRKSSAAKDESITKSDNLDPSQHQDKAVLYEGEIVEALENPTYSQIESNQSLPLENSSQENFEQQLNTSQKELESTVNDTQVDNKSSTNVEIVIEPSQQKSGEINLKLEEDSGLSASFDKEEKSDASNTESEGQFSSPTSEMSESISSPSSEQVEGTEECQITQVNTMKGGERESLNKISAVEDTIHGDTVTDEDQCQKESEKLNQLDKVPSSTGNELKEVDPKSEQGEATSENISKQDDKENNEENKSKNEDSKKEEERIDVCRNTGDKEKYDQDEVIIKKEEDNADKCDKDKVPVITRSEEEESNKGSSKEDSKRMRSDSASADLEYDPGLEQETTNCDASSMKSVDSGQGSSEIEPETLFALSTFPAASHEQYIFYDFEIPQTLVGRLIGRKGAFVNRIKATTDATVVVHPHKNRRLKHCSVEGTRQQVSAALELIREQFPTSRYPDVTLEQVSGNNSITPGPPAPVNKQAMQMELTAGVVVEVRVSVVVSAGELWVQQPLHPSFSALHRLSACMNLNYQDGATTPPLPLPVQEGTVCVGRVGEQWLRCQVLGEEEETGGVMVVLLDTGGTYTLPSTALRQIRYDYMALPFQATQCFLQGIQPAEGDAWSEEATTAVSELVGDTILFATVVSYTPDYVPLVSLYRRYHDQYVHLNERLVELGHATWVSPPPS